MSQEHWRKSGKGQTTLVLVQGIGNIINNFHGSSTELFPEPELKSTQKREGSILIYFVWVLFGSDAWSVGQREPCVCCHLQWISVNKFTYEGVDSESSST